MSCSSCGNEKTLARGLCGGCYHRLRRSGSVKRKYVINSGKCSVSGCDQDAFAKNLCSSHYYKAQNPLKTVWKLLRSRNHGLYPRSWDRFETFLSDVGARPTSRHQLRRFDVSKPYSKQNCRWVAPLSSSSGMSKDDRSAYGREWALQKRFKIDGEKFRELLAKQNGKCAICGGRETHVYKSGKVKELSVDHCHDKKHVRGLLCSQCNRGLGLFKDKPEFLEAAANYLRNHKRLI